MSDEHAGSTERKTEHFNKEEDLRNLNRLFVVGSHGFATERMAANTVRAYSNGWRHFVNWCEWRGRSPLPPTPETVVSFAQDCMAGHVSGAPWRKQSVYVAVSAIMHIYRRTFPYEQVHHRSFDIVYAYLRNATEGPTKVPMAKPAELSVFSDSAPTSLHVIRTRCLVTLMFEELLRVYELAALTVDDYASGEGGPALFYRPVREPQDKQWHPITERSAAALNEWLRTSEITSGPIFCDLRFCRVKRRPLSLAYLQELVEKASPGWRALRRAHIRDAMTSRATPTGRFEQNMRRGGKEGMKYLDRENSTMRRWLATRGEA